MRKTLAMALCLLSTPALAQIGSGATFPPGNCNQGGGSLFYLTAGDAGLYICQDDAWVKQIGPDGGAAWGGITGTLSNQSDLQTALNGKQASLVSATNIKTINGDSVLGSGDLVVSGSGLPAGLITLILSGTCPNGFEEVPEFNGKTVIGTLAANGNVGTTGGSDTITPQGVNSAPAFTGTPFTDVINHSHAVNDPGHTHLTQRYPTATGGLSGFTIDTSMSGTLADNTLPTKAGTTGVTVGNPVGGVASITPAGTVAAPTFTGTQFDNRSAFIRVIFCRKT